MILNEFITSAIVQIKHGIDEANASDSVWKAHYPPNISIEGFVDDELCISESGKTKINITIDLAKYPWLHKDNA